MRNLLATIGSAVSALAVAILVAGPAAATPATPLVDSAWLRANGAKPEVVILDVRNKLGGGSRAVFRQGHIPGSVYSNYLSGGWRVRVDGVPGQLPPVADLERLIGGLGIDNDSHVVIVAGGTSALDMGSATRIYWTFKVMGHDQVSILDGGYRAYVEDAANPVETGAVSPSPKRFTADLRPEMVADADAVLAARKAGVAMIDMRPANQYRGEKKHPLAKRAGTIPQAVNVPESKITGSDGRFVSPERVAELLAQVGVTAQDYAIAFCNTGHWASLGWFARSEILGQKNVKLYDGSMVDWSARAELPVEVLAQTQ
jgi:thiosulfate/3-mercaptopyruvate sulfurtransferase